MEGLGESKALEGENNFLLSQLSLLRSLLRRYAILSTVCPKKSTKEAKEAKETYKRGKRS